jgi:hypothetical protein
MRLVRQVWRREPMTRDSKAAGCTRIAEKLEDCMKIRRPGQRIERHET